MLSAFVDVERSGNATGRMILCRLRRTEIRLGSLDGIAALVESRVECQDVDDYLPFVVEIGQFLDNYVYPGAMRNFLAEGTANDARLTTCIPGYKSIWGLDLQSYQVYSRCILLDTETGYRSQFVAVSGIVEL